MNQFLLFFLRFYYKLPFAYLLVNHFYIFTIHILCSYYYAHGNSAKGPKWDGKEEPRLLSKTESSEKSTNDGIKYQTTNINDYAWLDEKGCVKIYIDWEGANEIEDKFIFIENDSNSFQFYIVHEPTSDDESTAQKRHMLKLTNLLYEIDTVTTRKKSKQFVLVLKKVEVQPWLTLRGKVGGDM